jgi:hypothetical protein
MSHVNVIYHYDAGSWWADSPDIDRWSAAADEISELVELVVDGVPFALEKDDVEISHFPAPDLMGVFSGGTAGAKVRVQIENAFRGLLPDPPLAGVGDQLHGS